MKRDPGIVQSSDQADSILYWQQQYTLLKFDRTKIIQKLHIFYKTQPDRNKVFIHT